jgi:orotidine-5'-phosphate decarboxylase
MTRHALIEQIQKKKSYLCVGLDTRIDRLPNDFKRDASGVLAFNKMVIEVTADYAVAYKPNLAFFEELGSEGWDVLKETIAYIPEECLSIADAKRGDIGNTAEAYARAIFNDLNADAVTVSPYMGEDAVRPFLETEGKFTIVLGLTSNDGAADFQYHGTPPLYERVIAKCREWGDADRLMFVIGATRADDMAKIRALAPDNFFLVPGVGTQGGDLVKTSHAGFIKTSGGGCGLLVNSSRGIIYAQGESHYRASIRAAARIVKEDMERLLQAADLI